MMPLIYHYGDTEESWMGWSQQTGELGQVIGYRNNETGEKISPKELLP